jgi:hypothetical protein
MRNPARAWVQKPWGKMMTLVQTKNTERGMWLKYLSAPTARLSEQHHHHRAELHIGLCKIPRHHRDEFRTLEKAWSCAITWVTNDDHECHLGVWYVRPLMRHRLQYGRFLEVVWGRLDEDDIVRTHDDHTRV